MTAKAEWTEDNRILSICPCLLLCFHLAPLNYTCFFVIPVQMFCTLWLWLLHSTWILLSLVFIDLHVCEVALNKKKISQNLKVLFQKETLYPSKERRRRSISLCIIDRSVLMVSGCRCKAWAAFQHIKLLVMCAQPVMGSNALLSNKF